MIREATEVLNGSPGRICRYGVSDDEGFDAGLTCGGSIAVAVYALDPALVPVIAEAVANDTSIAMTVRLSDERLGEQRLVRGDLPAETELDTAALALLELGESGIVELSDGEPCSSSRTRRGPTCTSSARATT